MSSINPFSGYLAQGTQVERSQAREKSRQIRRTQAMAKNVAQRDDELEHQVESSDAVTELHDDQKTGQQRKRKNPPHTPAKPDQDDQPRLDITA